jgi:redox-sensing transcriptional repressor
MRKKVEIPKNTIHRLIVYRKALKLLWAEGEVNIFSHKLATLTERTPAQVRRDLMLVGYMGTPVHGYRIDALIESINHYIDKPSGQSVIIIGLGNLGRAILDYCIGKNQKLSIIASFDVAPEKVNKLFSGIPCFHINELEHFMQENSIDVAILTVPNQAEAQSIATKIVKYGVRGIINYSTARLKLPVNVYVENRDLMVALEKAAFFSRIIKDGEKISDPHFYDSILSELINK